MPKHLLIFTFLSIFIFAPSVHAHPGRTDGNGGHTCRTNCASWGLGTGEYHTHGGGSSGGSTDSSYTAPAVEANQPEFNQKFLDHRKAVLSSTPTKIPIRIPTKTPIPSPTTKLSVTPTKAPTPTIKPKITAIPEESKQVKIKPQGQGFFSWFFNIFKYDIN